MESADFLIKQQFNDKFPDCTYFDFWTLQENYSVRTKESFALAVNFEGTYVINVLYEYDPILDHVLNLSAYGMNSNMGYVVDTLVEINVKKQFILIKYDKNKYDKNKYDIIVLGQYDTHKQAFDAHTNDKLPPNKPSAPYVVVDLQYTTPYFFGTKTRNFKPRSTNARVGIFYHKTTQMIYQK